LNRSPREPVSDLQVGPMDGLLLTEQTSVILSSIREAVILTDPDGIVRYWNEEATRVFGWTAAEMTGRSLAGRYDEPRRSWIDREIRKRLDGEEWNGEYEDLRKDGTPVWIEARVMRVQDASGKPIGVLGLSHEITERKRARQALLGQNRVLKRIAENDRLGDVLDEIVGLVEEQLPGSFCSVLILSADGTRLRVGSGRSLPADYNAAIDGVRIGPCVGSCGTAAFRRETVIVSDIDTDPLWADYKRLALDRGLRCCWSFPIFGANPVATVAATLLGTFALYRREAVGPEPAVSAVLEGAASLAGLAIERENVRRQLAESEERFRLLVDGVRDYAVFLTDPDGRIMTWNSGAERTLRRPHAEAIDAPIASLFWLEDPTATRARPLFDTAMLEGRIELEEWHFRHDGTRFLANVVVTALFHEGGVPRGFAWIVRDLSDRRRLEDQLRQSQKLEAIGRLAGGIAHDFNNLLTIINGFSELLLGEIAAGSPHRESLEAIHEAGERAAGLTGQLLAFSRKAIVEPKVLNVHDAIASTAKMLQRMPQRGTGGPIRLRLDLDGHGRIRADRGQFDQLVMNLAVNARDAMPDGGELLLKARDLDLPEPLSTDDGTLLPGAYLELTFADTGIGMTPETRGKIFEPFFTTKGVGRGTGLGLATVYGIVKQMGGSIGVDSQPGLGSTFRILLPAVEPPARTTAPTTARTAAQTPAMTPARTIGETRPVATTEDQPSRGTILLVEDEGEVRRLARIVLTSQGYRILEAASGEEAIRLATAETGTIELLITDVIVPGIGGRKLAETIRRQRPETRVVFIRGNPEESIAQHAERLGDPAEPDPVLTKPFTPALLTQIVRRCLSHREE
jgi:PAS domain S-box-containing protein